MFEIIKDYYNERKFMKQFNKEPFDFDANFEMPNHNDLASDIVAATPRPVIKVIPNELAESLPANAVAVDRKGVLKKLFESEGEEAFVYAGCLTRRILTMPGLNIIILDGIASLVEIAGEARDSLSDLSKNFQVTSIGDNVNALNLLLPPETASQLWDMDQVKLVSAGVWAEEFNDKNVDKTVAAKIAGQRIPYLVKERDVRTVRANLRLGDYGFRMTLL